MKSKACLSAAATLGCHRSTMKTTLGPSSGLPVHTNNAKIENKKFKIAFWFNSLYSWGGVRRVAREGHLITQPRLCHPLAI